MPRRRARRPIPVNDSISRRGSNPGIRRTRDPAKCTRPRPDAPVANVGGTIQSSQVDVLGSQASNGLVGLVVSCEMEQASLQKLLYDLEAGMPFLFVDQLDVQVPQTTVANEDGSGRIRVVLGV